jgi:WD40 repeat protein
VRVWDAASWVWVRTLGDDNGSILACAYAPDGRQIALAGADGTVLVWDAASGELVRTLRSQGPVRACVYAPGGRQLASVGDDGTVRIWDPASEGSLSVAAPAITEASRQHHHYAMTDILAIGNILSRS